MTMKIKNSLFESVQYNESMTKIHQSPKLSVMDAYRINRLVKNINELQTEYNGLKETLLEKFGEKIENSLVTDEGVSEDPETTTTTFQIQPEKREEFIKEMNELLAIEHDLETERLPFPQKIDEGITVGDIDVLNIFFDFGFDEPETSTDSKE